MCLLLAGLSTLPMVSFKGFAFWTALCGVPYSVVFVFIGHAASLGRLTQAYAGRHRGLCQPIRLNSCGGFFHYMPLPVGWT